eukprot:514697-Rhodomonas_salina.1
MSRSGQQFQRRQAKNQQYPGKRSHALGVHKNEGDSIPVRASELECQFYHDDKPMAMCQL